MATSKLGVRASLHIGINYRGTSAELYGCENDARDWAGWAASQGFEPDLLLERAATRENILVAVEKLRARVGWRGRALLTISSHGTPIPDRDGDEIDGYDEAFVPYDYQTAGVISDDDLYVLLGRRRYGSRWITISDCCYSGTLSRFAGMQDSAGRTGTVGARRARYMPPRVSLIADDRGAGLLELPADTHVITRGRPRNSGALFAACAENEVAWDATIRQRPNGAYSRALLDALEVLGSTASLAQLHAFVRTPQPDQPGRLTLPSSVFPQTPQLQASALQRRWALRG